jgi:hypothetical protein
MTQQSDLSPFAVYCSEIRALDLLGYTDWMDTKIFVVA